MIAVARWVSRLLAALGIVTMLAILAWVAAQLLFALEP